MQRIFLEDKEMYNKIVLRLDGNYSIIEKILDIDFTEYKTLDLDCVDALQQRLKYCSINSKDAYEAYKYLKDGLTDVKADNVAWLLKQSNLYEFNFEDAIDCLDKPYLSATSVNSKDQFSLLSEMCRSDGERSVSYTHLDVYKRQSNGRVATYGRPPIKIKEGYVMFDEKRLAPWDGIGRSAVSYTHLDVYKRQIIDAKNSGDAVVYSSLIGNSIKRYGNTRDIDLSVLVEMCIRDRL